MQYSSGALGKSACRATTTTGIAGIASYALGMGEPPQSPPEMLEAIGQVLLDHAPGQVHVLGDFGNAQAMAPA